MSLTPGNVSLVDMCEEMVRRCLEQSTYPTGGNWAQRLASGQPLFFDDSQNNHVIFYKNKPLAIFLTRNLPDGVELDWFCMNPEYWGNRRLAQQVWALWERELGTGEIWLEVHKNNAPAKSFYERQGFEITGLRPKYYRDGAAALLMAKSVGTETSSGAS